MTAADFFRIASHINGVGSFAIFIVSWFIFLFYLGYIVSTTLRKNRMLLVLILAIVTYVTDCIIFLAGVVFKFFSGTFVFALNVSIDLFIHWMFCYMYLKLSIEVKYMFDRRIYFDTGEIMLEINREKLCL